MIESIPYNSLEMEQAIKGLEYFLERGEMMTAQRASRSHGPRGNERLLTIIQHPFSVFVGLLSLTQPTYLILKNYWIL